MARVVTWHRWVTCGAKDGGLWLFVFSFVQEEMNLLMEPMRGVDMCSSSCLCRFLQF